MGMLSKIYQISEAVYAKGRLFYSSHVCISAIIRKKRSCR